ncbi:hypothetical protein HAX54_015311 [Datura stramonium]|uniref:Uncharacterized protein n=1 Tax=Datura stramonium TaxID=4076 RepID=A0ABS8TPF1_DATST|nr:hypothetical protein [Datura stramonium]
MANHEPDNVGTKEPSDVGQYAGNYTSKFDMIMGNMLNNGDAVNVHPALWQFNFVPIVDITSSIEMPLLADENIA